MNEVKPANLFNLDYRKEAEALARCSPLIDVHTHIGDAESAKIYASVMKCFSVEHVFTMTQLEEVDAVRSVLGDSVHFIAFPRFRGEDPIYDHTDGYLERISRFYDKGARIVKFWAAPRGIDFGTEFGDPSVMRINAPHRIAQMELAASKGMMFMVHVSDPDTWFKTKYGDVLKYGSKEDQYKPFEELLQQFEGPWIAAHMGGNPENLRFLSGLLDRHENLYLDSSATKWMVRELSKYQRNELAAFLSDYRGRVFFGSDIVTMRSHLEAEDDGWEMERLSSSKEEAFDLYASRYYALRTMFETEFRGKSPIADPDLALVDPDSFSELDSPEIFGHNLPEDVLAEFYHGAAKRFFQIRE